MSEIFFLAVMLCLFHTILCVCVFFCSYKCHVLVIQFLFLNPDFFVVFVFFLWFPCLKSKTPIIGVHWSASLLDNLSCCTKIILAYHTDVLRASSSIPCWLCDKPKEGLPSKTPSMNVVFIPGNDPSAPVKNKTSVLSRWATRQQFSCGGCGRALFCSSLTGYQHHRILYKDSHSEKI